jgi:hypothetical protein
MSGTRGLLTPAQVEWLKEALGIGDDAFITPDGADGPIGFNVPSRASPAASPQNSVNQALDALQQMPNGVPLQGRTQFTPNNIRGTGPMVRVPADELPARVLEVGAGGTPTDLGLPPDPNLVQVTRTDFSPPPAPDLTQDTPGDLPPQARLTQFNAEQPPPPELTGFDAAMINNPRGYVPDLESVAQTLRRGGNIIAQGNAPYNPDFTEMLDQVPPPGEPTPAGLSFVDRTAIATQRGPSTVVPKPGQVMGGPFYRTEGEPIEWPNTRVVVTSRPPPGPGEGPDAPGDTGPGDGVGAAGTPDPAPSCDGPPVETAPEAPTNAIRSIEPGSPDLTANPTPGEPVPYELGNQPLPGQAQVRPSDGSPVADPRAQTGEIPAVEPPGTAPETSAGGDGAPGAGAGDAAGAEAAEAGLGGAAETGVVGGLMAGGLTLYDDLGKVRSGQMSTADAVKDVGEKTGEVGALTVGGKVIADVAGAGDAAAGAAGDAAGAGLGAAGMGGVVGGVVTAGLALIDDVGKVEDGTMTGGHAAVDVTAKTAVGVGAGMAGAAAGAEVGAAIGSVIPGAGTVVGLVAGAVVGGAVGYVGNKLMNTETGKAILDAAGNAVDTAIDGVKEAEEAIGDAASAAKSAVSDAASAAVDAAESAASAVEDAASSAASEVEDAASSAASAVEDAAGSAVDAIKSIF